MDIQNTLLAIQEEIKLGLISLGYYDETIEIILETPKDRQNGDYATNIAMRYAKAARKAPKAIAEELITIFDQKRMKCEKIEVAGPGFINFYIDKSYVLEIIATINKQGKDYGTLVPEVKEHYNIEFVSVNPTGALHIGHARGAAAGDSMCKIIQKAGHDVTKEYYVNDAGNQIHNLAISIDARYKELFDQEVNMPTDGYYGPEIIEAAKEIINKYGDKFLNEDGYEFFRDYGVNTLLDGLKKDLHDFRVDFDVWFSEKSLYDQDVVNKTVKFLNEQGYTYELDGATWLKTSQFNDEKDRVIIKSDGNFTYLTPDIAYHKNKLDRGYTKLIDILGGDHHGYIDRLKASIEMVGGKSDLLEVEILQMVKVLQNGTEVKMSKRSGKAITLRDLMDDVGVDPIRYFFAMRSLNTHMDLDLDLALKQTNENPVYYVQYAHARICSIFEQAQNKGVDTSNLPSEFTTLDGDKIFDLVAILRDYPEAIALAAKTRAPHKITNYINNLASAFHSFYNSEQVITDDSLKTSERLALLKSVQIVLKDSLELVGVTAPQKM